MKPSTCPHIHQQCFPIWHQFFLYDLKQWDKTSNKNLSLNINSTLRPCLWILHLFVNKRVYFICVTSFFNFLSTFIYSYPVPYALRMLHSAVAFVSLPHTRFWVPAQILCLKCVKASYINFKSIYQNIVTIKWHVTQYKNVSCTVYRQKDGDRMDWLTMWGSCDGGTSHLSCIPIKLSSDICAIYVCRLLFFAGLVASSTPSTK